MTEKKLTIHEKLREIQKELKVPKSQFNSYGKYAYRNAEDIIESVKPLNYKHGLFLIMTDEVRMLGNRFYIVAKVTLTDGTESITVEGIAREEETKKGMDGSQITGASSSYARKYALNGLYSIDDSRTSDQTNEHEAKPPKKGGQLTQAQLNQELTKAMNEYMSKLQSYGYNRDWFNAQVEQQFQTNIGNIDTNQIFEFAKYIVGMVEYQNQQNPQQVNQNQNQQQKEVKAW
jgi:essential recombination function protein